MVGGVRVVGARGRIPTAGWSAWAEVVAINDVLPLVCSSEIHVLMFHFFTVRWCANSRRCEAEKRVQDS